MADNPFYWGSPISEIGEIIGRDEQAIEISSWLRSGNNARILGPRRVGKTTFLNKLADELLNPPKGSEPWTLIIIDLTAALSLNAFLRAIVKSAYQYLNRKQIRQLEQYFTVIEKSRNLKFSIKDFGFNSSTKSISTIAETQDLIELSLQAILDSTPNIVFAFDECQSLNEYDISLNIIRQTLMNNSQQKASVLMTGSIRHTMQMMFENHNESIWTQMKAFDLRRIDNSLWTNYLELSAEATQKPFTMEAVDYLLHTTQSHSLRTQELASHSWALTNKKQGITVEKVITAWENILHNSNYANQARIAEMVAEGNTNLAKILFYISKNGTQNLTAKQTMIDYGINDKKTVERSKDELIRLGILEDLQGQIIISDPLFAEWLRKNPMI